MDAKEYRRKAWIDVRALRVSRGWIQDETAKKLGIARSHLSAIENNKCGITIQTMDAFIRVFGLKYEDFFDGDGATQ